ncbi:MAG: helix-hairpin-helix domain-containing protein, partial [Synergistaceae bacterium]|nr:helix-hairpin-helix domain-containing protein [Synergistaceae bacterium]
DDFRSIQETVSRRYGSTLKGNEPLPQLVLIDGGPIQLEFAKKALEDLGLTELTVVSLAKEEELIYHSSGTEPLRLDFSDPALRLLQRVRDESHRFAVESHRTSRSARLRRSLLEDIPGIGKHRTAQLLGRFGSMGNILNLSPEELATVPGIGPKLAGQILSFLKENAHGPSKEKD